ncbi:MAG: hypothetical protein NZR01_17295 [Bryobacteraceae bacterium]|nr:hypothetical protein [Bryobacteraceae bacterium]
MKLWKSLTVLFTFAFCLSANDAVGRWKLAANAPDGNTYQVTLVVKEDNGRLSGVLDSERGAMPLQNVVYANGELRFDLVLDMGAIPFRLKIEGDRISGTLTAPDGSTGSVTGQREGGGAAVAVSGKWEITAVDPDGTRRRATLDLKQDGERLTGAITLETGDSLPISEGRLAGATVSFKIPVGDGEIAVSGNVAGDSVSGTYTTPTGEKGKFSGQRAGAAQTPLTGKWNVVARDSEGNELRSTLELKVDGGRLSGVITTESGDSAPLVDGKVEGGGFSFKIYIGDGNIEVKGRMENGRLTGEYTTPNGSKGTYVATRG